MTQAVFQELTWNQLMTQVDSPGIDSDWLKTQCFPVFRLKSTHDSSKKHLTLSRLMVRLWVIPMSGWQACTMHITVSRISRSLPLMFYSTIPFILTRMINYNFQKHANVSLMVVCYTKVVGKAFSSPEADANNTYWWKPAWLLKITTQTNAAAENISARAQHNAN